MTAAITGSRPEVDVDPPPRLVLLTVVVAIAFLPVLRPTAAAQITPFDVVGLLAVAVTALWASRPGVHLRLPYALPVVGMVCAGGIAGLHSHSSGSVIALGQDLFLLAWCGAVATVGATRRGREVVVVAWVWTATACAVYILSAVAIGRPDLAGAIEEYGGRVALSFGDPNLAGGYFVTSLFIVNASSRPMRRPARTLVIIVLLGALALTGSNGSVLGLALGTVVAAGVIRIRRGAAPLGLTVLAVSALGLLAADLALDRSRVRQAATAGSSSVLANTLGRTDESASDRSTLLRENLALYRDGSLFGVGPGQAKSALSARLASYTKEAHNDYVAALVERGILGAVALLAFAFALTTTLVRATAAAPTSVVVRPSALAGAAVAFAVAGLFYEVLHFRHFWAFAGLLAAIALPQGERG